MLIFSKHDSAANLKASCEATVTLPTKWRFFVTRSLD